MPGKVKTTNANVHNDLWWEGVRKKATGQGRLKLTERIVTRIQGAGEWKVEQPRGT